MVNGVVVTLAELVALRGYVRGAHLRLAGAVAPVAGQHLTLAGNRGMEFFDSRPYQVGDDVRAIDWRQSARRGELYTKRFRQEREWPLLVMVDMGPSMRFGTRVAFKSVLAARLAALLTWQTSSAGDRVGGGLTDGNRYAIRQAKRGDRGVLSLLQLLVDPLPLAAPAGGLADALRGMACHLHPGCRIAVISDFYQMDHTDSGQVTAAAPHDGLVAVLGDLASRHALTLIQIHDPLEAAAPPPGRYTVTDTQRFLTLDLAVEARRAAFIRPYQQRRAALGELARRLGVRHLDFATDMPPEGVLAAFRGRQSPRVGR